MQTETAVQTRGGVDVTCSEELPSISLNECSPQKPVPASDIMPFNAASSNPEIVTTAHSIIPNDIGVFSCNTAPGGTPDHKDRSLEPGFPQEESNQSSLSQQEPQVRSPSPSSVVSSAPARATRSNVTLPPGYIEGVKYGRQPRQANKPQHNAREQSESTDGAEKNEIEGEISPVDKPSSVTLKGRTVSRKGKEKKRNLFNTRPQENQGEVTAGVDLGSYNKAELLVAANEFLKNNKRRKLSISKRRMDDLVSSARRDLACSQLASWANWSNEKEEQRLEMYLKNQRQSRTIIEEAIRDRTAEISNNPLLAKTHHVPPIPFFRRLQSSGYLEPPHKASSSSTSNWELASDDIESDLRLFREFKNKQPLPESEMHKKFEAETERQRMGAAYHSQVGYNYGPQVFHQQQNVSFLPNSQTPFLEHSASDNLCAPRGYPQEPRNINENSSLNGKLDQRTPPSRPAFSPPQINVPSLLTNSPRASLDWGKPPLQPGQLKSPATRIPKGSMEEVMAGRTFVSSSFASGSLITATGLRLELDKPSSCGIELKGREKEEDRKPNSGIIHVQSSPWNFWPL